MTWTWDSLAVIGVTLLITFIYTTSLYFVFVPAFGGLNVASILILAPFHALVWLLITNYYLAITTDPGVADGSWVPDTNAVVVQVKKSDATLRTCRQCKHYKPPRAHHCSSCQKCVLRMDHHCPWINNCVGYYNVGHFYRFIVCVVLGVGYALLLHCLRLYEIATMARSYDTYLRPVDTTELLFLALNLIACLFVFFPVLVLTVVQTLCVMGNATTIERWELDKVAELVRKKRVEEVAYPYDLGVYRNVCAVLGNNPLLWMLPQHMKGDGVAYESNVVEGHQVVWPPPEYELVKKNRELQERRRQEAFREDQPVGRHVRRDSEGYVVVQDDQFYARQRRIYVQPSDTGESDDVSSSEDEPIGKMIARQQEHVGGLV